MLGSDVTWTLSLNGPAVQPITVQVDSSNSAVASVANVTVPAGATSVEVPIQTLSTGETTITVRLGTDQRSAVLTVVPGEVRRSISTTVDSPHRFVPDQVQAPAGARVVMTFTNPSNEPHTFTVPGLVDVSVGPGQLATFAFNMPATSTGFVCKFHQHEGMDGTLIPG